MTLINEIVKTGRKRRKKKKHVRERKIHKENWDNKTETI